MGAEVILAWIDAAVREATLFAAVGFLIGGIDDLMVDAAFLFRRLRHGRATRSLAALPQPARPGRLAIFVPAWDEAAVIGRMLTTALARLDHADYRLFVGCYPNDPATIAAVAAIAERDPRVRLAIVPHDGPTTKADCLNALWRALARDDALAGRQTRAAVLHDAEDVVHPLELRVYDALLEAHGVVQIPVLPLIDRGAIMVSGHYADEFAESHGRQMVVRAAIGAGLPLAGVGCAIAVDVLEALDATQGAPFDATSLTEDYELGLRAAAAGWSACFARVTDDAGELIAVRAYFPATVKTAVVQKARWMTGIALAGWDRIGWGRPLHLAEHWMRMRDRRAPLAVLVLAVAYAALVGWGIAAAGHALRGTTMPGPGDGLALLLLVNLALLAWRLAMRVAATARSYGWREGLWALPRAFVSNVIALLAARRAAGRYAAILAGRTPRWDKTAHVFPPDEAIAG